MLDLEDFNESVALNEFTLDDFRMELASYIEANREKLEEAPFGLYAVVPPHAEYQSIKPGAIYCLKQRHRSQRQRSREPACNRTFWSTSATTAKSATTSPQPKQILEIFRAVCQGKTEPYAELCELFDQETSNGQDMSRYSALLDKAVAAIAAQFGRKNAGNLFAGRGGKLTEASKQVKHDNRLRTHHLAGHQGREQCQAVIPAAKRIDAALQGILHPAPGAKPR